MHGFLFSLFKDFILRGTSFATTGAESLCMSKRKGAADSEELGGVPAERSLSPQLAGRKCESSDADADADARSRKRAKRKQARKAKSLAQADEEDVDEEAQVNLTVGRMDPGLLSDRMARQIKRFEPSLTPVELGDLMIPRKSLIEDTGGSAKLSSQVLTAHRAILDGHDNMVDQTDC